MSGIGGPGFPQPDVPGKGVDFGQGPVSLNSGGAADLGLLALAARAKENKHEHQHYWTVFGKFRVVDKAMAKLAEAKLNYDNAVANGDTTAEFNAPILLDGETLYGLEGPGCLKCQAHWSMPEEPMMPGFGGYGYLCPINDKEWIAANGPLPNNGDPIRVVGPTGAVEMPPVVAPNLDDEIVDAEVVEVVAEGDIIFDSLDLTPEQVAEVERVIDEAGGIEALRDAFKDVA